MTFVGEKSSNWHFTFYISNVLNNCYEQFILKTGLSNENEDDRGKWRKPSERGPVCVGLASEGTWYLSCNAPFFPSVNFLANVGWGVRQQVSSSSNMVDLFTSGDNLIDKLQSRVLLVLINKMILNLSQNVEYLKLF